MKKYLLLIYIIFSGFVNIKSQTLEQCLDSTYINFIYLKYDKAIDWGKKTVPMLENQVNQDTSIELSTIADTILALTTGIIAQSYYSNGNLDSAIKYATISVALCRKTYKTDHEQLAVNIGNLAQFLFKSGNFAKSEPLYKEALEMNRRLAKTENQDLATSINNNAVFHMTIGNYTLAESLLKEAYEMQKRISNGDSKELANTINNLAFFYQNKGDYTTAEPLFSEALQMCRRFFNGNNITLATCINNIGLFYYDIGNYNAAEPYITESIAMYKEIYRSGHSQLASSLNNAAAFFEITGKYDIADSLYNESINMFRKTLQGDHPDLASVLSNYALFLDFRGNPDKAEPIYNEALKMTERLYKVDHPYLASSMNNMAVFMEGKGKYIEADSLYRTELAMMRRLYTMPHPYLAIAIANYGMFNYIIGNEKVAEALYNESLQLNIKMLSNYFPSLSEKEKKLFWNTVSRYFERFVTFTLHRMKSNPAVLSNLYDIRLFTKALLLNSANQIKETIMNTGDSILIKKYKQWSDTREFLVKLYKMTDEELKSNHFSVDSVENEANILEKDISLKSAKFAENNNKREQTWKEVRAKLKPGEAAVEVIRFRLTDKRRTTDTILYAFLIAADYTKNNPDIVVLDEGNLLENEYYQFYRNKLKVKRPDRESFDRYWGKLYEKLKKYKTVYFSVDGIYNKLNPSAFLMPDGSYLLEHQDVRIINSTKDILLNYNDSRKGLNTNHNAVLIGNPNFGLDENKTREISEKIQGVTDTSKKDIDKQKIRGISLSSLPGTEQEINNIERYLKSQNWDVTSYLGDQAVKAAVKNIKSPGILHIATHGFFLEDVRADIKDFFGFKSQKVIENPLLRSGLFFSGAENYFRTDSVVATEEENGLLTAYEAMNLNLDNTDLVVLSACETGLGDIQNGEGVFGLRRAFQQAGARTIVMSLWPVDDKATQELMSEFYKNLVSGQSKREAFKNAQLEIRTRYPEPVYWGSFVMIGE